MFSKTNMYRITAFLTSDHYHENLFLEVMFVSICITVRAACDTREQEELQQTSNQMYNDGSGNDTTRAHMFI